MSGSWSSSARSRRRAFHQTTTIGSVAPATITSRIRNDEAPATAKSEPRHEACADADVGELDGPQRQVRAHDQAMQRVPDLQVAERLLRRLQHRRGGREPLLHRPARALALLLAEVRGELAADLGAVGSAEREHAGAEDAEPDEERGQQRPDPEEWRPGSAGSTGTTTAESPGIDARRARRRHLRAGSPRPGARTSCT